MRILSQQKWYVCFHSCPNSCTMAFLTKSDMQDSSSVILIDFLQTCFGTYHVTFCSAEYNINEKENRTKVVHVIASDKYILNCYLYTYKYMHIQYLMTYEVCCWKRRYHKWLYTYTVDNQKQLWVVDNIFKRASNGRCC